MSRLRSAAATGSRILRGAARPQPSVGEDRLEELHRRLDLLERSTERFNTVAAMLAALEERQASTQALLGNVELLLNSLAQQVVDLQRAGKLDAMAQRLDALESLVAKMRPEVEAAGALAATAVAAADEIAVLGPSLRGLRKELIDLARQDHRGNA